MSKTTLSGLPPTLPDTAAAPGPQCAETGLHDDYWVISEPERSDTMVRALRRSYRHRTCGMVTSMALPIAQTFACDPGFYTHTFCCHCRDHLPIAEFDWTDDGQVVGS